jgi:hypothetical protein
VLEKEFNLNHFLPDVQLRVTEDGRLVIPILDAEGVRRGDVVRQGKPYDMSRPKSLTYCDEDYSGLAWFMPELVTIWTPLCLVEDPISAARLASNDVVGVAILGVYLTRPKLTDIRNWAEGMPIHLALDADAHAVAVRQAIRHRNRVDLRVHKLYHDVKDMDTDELGNFLRELAV